MSKKIVNYLLLILIGVTVLQLLATPKQLPKQTNNSPISITTNKKSYGLGKIIELNIYNYSDKTLAIKSNCPQIPFQIFFTSFNENTEKTSQPNIDCTKVNDLILKPETNTKFRLTYWSYSLFSEIGEYKITKSFKYQDEVHTVSSNTFEITERGFFAKIWVGLFYQPIYNFLIFLINLAPNKSLGFGIIILTIILRIILYFPNQKALIAQKKLSKIQPKLNAIKEQYKGNQQKIAEETMKIWKTHKVNPSSSCLPMLIQFPILIALFYVIQDGLNPDKTWLLYEFQKNFDLSSIQTVFLNSINLLEREILFLPIIVAMLQFIQLKLSTATPTTSTKIINEKNNEQALLQKTMLYFMPALIAIFTATLPSGVGIYWGTSTLFGILQQLAVNKFDKNN